MLERSPPAPRRALAPLRASGSRAAVRHPLRGAAAQAPPPAAVVERALRPRRARSDSSWRGLAAVCWSWSSTKWVVLAVVVGLVVAFWDRVFGGARNERAAIVRAEGLAAWIESLRDTIAGAVGLEQAIPATAANAAPSIRPALNLLVDRLRVREPLPDALAKFSDDLDDPSADLVVAALILNARLRGPGLRDVLTALATSARDELDVRRRVESSRRSTRRSVQIVVGVIVLVAALLVLFNREYVEPYGTPSARWCSPWCSRSSRVAVLWLRRLSGVSSRSASWWRPEAPAAPRAEGAEGMTLQMLAGAAVGVGVLLLVVMLSPAGARHRGDTGRGSTRAGTRALG